MRKTPYHARVNSADDTGNLRPTVTPRPSRSVPGSSRIPSPSRKNANPRTSTRNSPLRSRSPSISPSRIRTLSPGMLQSPDKEERMSHSQDFGAGDSGSGRNLVRYITPDMIRRIAKEDQFDQIRSLNFNLVGDKKIRYIENLEETKNLTTLSFGGNVITKIEKIDHLVKLRELNLSNNRISKIEGLDTLVNLQTLNLSGNHIEVIPLWLTKKLKLLRTLKLANNNISSLSEVIKLRNLHDLHQLTIAGNPLTDVPHYRQYIVFHLRALEQLDGQIITINERSAAATRFSQEELDRVTRELQSTKDELEKLQEQHNASMEEIEVYTMREQDFEERDVTAQETREELEHELNVKDDLLKNKAKELQKAQTRQYQLEQELAFYKLDAKFEPYNIPQGVDLSDDDSPYLGKSPYKRGEFSSEGRIGVGAQRKAHLVDVEGKKKLQGELDEKNKLLKKAGDQLTALEEELRNTQKQLNDASVELDKLKKENNEYATTEAQRKKLRQKLQAKIQKLEQMKEQAEKLEDAISAQQDDIQNRKREIDKMKEKLKHLDPNSPDYAALKSEIEKKEDELKDAEQQLKDLESRLTKLLKSIAVETEAIKQIEEQLRKGEADDSLRNDLEEIVAGLQDYLLNVRKKANAQRAQVEALLRDKERLRRHLNDLENENNRMAEDAEDYRDLQNQVGVLGELNDLLQATQDLSESIMHSVPPTPSVANGDEPRFPELTNDAKKTMDAAVIAKTLNSLNKSLNEMKDLNEALQNEASELSMHDADLQAQLVDAENKINRLEKASHDYRDKLGQQMEETARLQNIAGDKEAEARSLKKELHATKAKLSKAVDNMLTPAQVRERIAKLQDAIKRGDHSGLKDDDEIGEALSELQKVLLDLLRREAEERENAEKRLSDLEDHMGKLKDKLMRAQQEYKDTLDAATNAKLEAEKRDHEKDLRRLQGEIENMKDKLDRAEEDATHARGKLREADRLKKQLQDMEDRAKLRDEDTQAALRELERELDDTRRDKKNRERDLEFNDDEIDQLRKTIRDMKNDQDRDARAARDAENAAARARRDLLRAEDEIKGLRDILRAQEGAPCDRDMLHQAHASLGQKESEVSRLRNLLNNLKADSADEINALLAEIDALRNALGRQGTHVRSLWPAGYYCVPPQPATGKWVYSPSKIKPLNGSYIYAPQETLKPGTPGMIVLQEDGTPVLVPFEGFYCNVPDHHDMEDEIARLKEKNKARKLEMEEEAEELQDLILEHKSTLEKLRNDEERMAREKAITAKELTDLKNKLTRKLEKKSTLEGQVTELLGEMRMEEALARQDDLQDELDMLERTINNRQAELRDMEKIMIATQNQSNDAHQKVEIMSERFKDLQNHYNESEQDCVELERRARDTSVHLVRATKELRQMEAHAKKAEARKIALDDECQQFTRLLNDKEAEFGAIQQKTDHMTANLERLQSELLLTEEKQSERLATLRESEKVLLERKNELSKVKEQADMQHDEVEALDRMLGKRKTELQLLVENIEDHQKELASVLRDGQTDVQEKQKQIKNLKHSIEELSSARADLEGQVKNRKEDIFRIREENERASEELQNTSSEIIKQKTELKHVLEMLGLENAELESLRKQHETKLTELDKTQRHLLDERTELDRLQIETQRKTVEMERNKQIAEKLRNDVDHLTAESTTLNDTINSLVKEKQFLADSCAGLEEKVQISKQGMVEAKLGVDKAKSLLEQLTREVDHARREVNDTNDEKISLAREVAVLKNTSRDLKSGVTAYRSEISEAEEKLRLLEQDFRDFSKQRDDVLLEITAAREEILHRTQQRESVNHSLRQKQEALEKLSRSVKEKEDALEEKERELQNITKEIEHEESRCGRILTQLSAEASRQQNDLNEKKEELEEISAKKDAIKREMERLGHFEDKFQDMSSEVSSLRSKYMTMEEQFNESERQRSDLKGRLSTAEGEIAAMTIEAEHEKQKLKEKLAEVEEALKRQRDRDASEISALESAAQDHCSRATRLSNELNELRMQYIQLKKQLRVQEETSDKKQLEMERALHNLKNEIKSEVTSGVNDLEISRIRAVDELQNLYGKRENVGSKLRALRERNYTPPTKLNTSQVDAQPSINVLREELAAQQEKIASQIRCQMSRHREAWEERKRQSEGKLTQLRKKVDNLDELVNNSMTRSSYQIDSVPASEDGFLDLPVPSRYNEDNENIHP